MPVLHAGILIAGLAAVALPVIIHLLLRRRKRPMEWGAMRFVLEAYRKTQRRTNVERWLLLACRCLLVAALAIALARPLVSGGSGGSAGGGRTYWFVLDDGLIGQATSDGRSDLAAAIERCKAMLATMAAGDRTGVLLAGSPPRALVSPPSGNLAGVAAALDSVKVGDGPSDWRGLSGLLAEAITTDRSARDQTGPAAGADVAVFAQSPRDGTGRVGEPLDRLPLGVRLLSAEPSGASPLNVAVVNVTALRPVFIGGSAGNEATQTVTVALRRFGADVDKAGRTRVRVAAGSQIQQDAGTGGVSVEWAAGQREALATLVVDPGASTASNGLMVLVASLESSGDAVPGDDRWRLPVMARDALRVGVIADATARGSSLSGGTADRFRPGQWVNLALRPSESAAVDLVEIEPGGLDPARLSGLDALVLLSPEAVPVGAEGWERLRRFADAGGLLLVTPPAEPTVTPWEESMTRGLGLGMVIGKGIKVYPPEQPGRLNGAAPLDLGGVDMLSTLRAELATLARPVAVLRLQAPLDGPPQSEASADDRGEVRHLLRMEDGTPIVTLVTRGGSKVGAGAGAVVYLAAPLDLRWTDLPAKPLMVPLMQELVRQGVGRARPVYLSQAGGTVRAPSGSVELRPADGADNQPVRVDPSGMSGEFLRSAGTWRAVDRDGAERGLVAVNAPALADTRAVDRTRLEGWLATALPPAGAGLPAPKVEWVAGDAWPQGLAAIGNGGDAVKVGTGSMLLLAALAFALIEVLLARSASGSAVRNQAEGVTRG